MGHHMTGDIRRALGQRRRICCSDRHGAADVAARCAETEVRDQVTSIQRVCRARVSELHVYAGISMCPASLAHRSAVVQLAVNYNLDREPLAEGS